MLAKVTESYSNTPSQIDIITELYYNFNNRGTFTKRGAMGVLVFFIALGLLVAFHELGHFLFAKLFGVKVEVFSIGFGPKVTSKKIGETEYCISLIPLGGYVKLAGELGQNKDELKNPSLFTSKPRWQQLIVYLAGPVFSVILGFLLLFTSYTSFGIPISRVASVQQNSPAEKAGIKPGDRILAVNDTNTQSPEEVIMAIGSSSDNIIIDIKVKRGATEELNMSIEPKIVDGVPKIGVSISRESIKNPAKALAMSLNTSKADAGIVISGLGQLLSGKVSPKEGLMGPIGMANLSNRVSSSRNWPFLFELWALISINLGIFNLLPISVLDGGNIAILTLEIILRRPLNQTIKIRFLKFGAALIVFLMVYIIYLDISRLLN
ncbi:MAG: hypothetical protein A3B91_00510 [Candidatus Yanofskybacteria bacterium RIFCSPHIGHO2_02_FULL_41_29]|nr:MAG: hypothetical protein A3B91_00510 [Candidatus Yanofskybacteria bacterium RIFCSPHIGHO2_02_FULL_41_29]OGN16998.1 MAG: hypothetical protein A3F48_00440 [Candidatus Yanofskybacteria bacterium RIFCSPHIGHO2_12_FULL_41_9]OGN29255.1 MAG: hypothetical protein A3H54_03725 [Candidatus Yanofskybacteria bacterium RIFCSPLOWO2_02_FULL_41_13]